MDLTKLSDGGLLSLYNAITYALEEDDAIPAGRPKRYGVRQYADFKTWGSALEAEIKRRGLKYTPIHW
jgi:hypothetical protein